MIIPAEKGGDLTDEHFNPYEAPQTITSVEWQESRQTWTAIPAFLMRILGAIHMSFGAAALFGLVLQGAVYPGIAGMVVGSFGTIPSVRGGRDWLRRDWDSAILRTIGVLMLYIGDLMLFP